MSIVGGFDVHRKQITFDYLDTVTGRCSAARSSRLIGDGWRDGCSGSPAAMMSRSRPRRAPVGGR